MQEEWRPVVGYEGLYEVSDLGNVVRVNSRLTAGQRRRLKAIVTKDGYRNVHLCRNGDAKTLGIHCVVAAAFFGPKQNNKQVNHKNGVRHDNRPENLEYVTRSENVIHSFEVLGREGVFGERNNKARATARDVALARRMLARGMPKKAIAEQFGHHLCWAYRIANGETRLRG